VIELPNTSTPSGFLLRGEVALDNYVMQTKKALVNVLRATDVFQAPGTRDCGVLTP
jgi:hypothetical protein